MKLAVAQFAVAATLEHNVQKIINVLGRAAVDGIEFVCFPEMCLTGYNKPVLDSQDLNRDVDNALVRIQNECRLLNVGALVGHGYRTEDSLVNRATVLLADGHTRDYDKVHLVAQEQKHFVPGSEHLVFQLGELKAGVIICRDQNDPLLARSLKEEGASVLFILSAHYYPPKESRWKIEKNRALPIARAVENGMYVLMANTVGAHYGLISLGNSLIVDPDGAVVVSAGEAEETLLSIDIRSRDSSEEA